MLGLMIFNTRSSSGMPWLAFAGAVLAISGTLGYVIAEYMSSSGPNAQRTGSRNKKRPPVSKALKSIDTQSDSIVRRTNALIAKRARLSALAAGRLWRLKACGKASTPASLADAKACKSMCKDVVRVGYDLGLIEDEAERLLYQCDSVQTRGKNRIKIRRKAAVLRVKALMRRAERHANRGNPPLEQGEAGYHPNSDVGRELQATLRWVLRLDSRPEPKKSKLTPKTRNMAQELLELMRSRRLEREAEAKRKAEAKARSGNGDASAAQSTESSSLAGAGMAVEAEAGM